MSGDIIDLIKELKLNESTADEALQDARDFALRCLKSKAPIPQTVMTVVERGAANHDTPESATEKTVIPGTGQASDAEQKQNACSP